MTKWVDKYWNNESRAGKTKNVTYTLAVISIMILLATESLRNQSSVSIASYTLDKMLVLSTGLTILLYSVYFQMRHDELTPPQIKPAAKPYIPDIAVLIGCSHNLDKVRNNLRTGIIFIFGISTALLAWIVNFGSAYGDSQAPLFAGSGILVLCTIIAILFSFSNPIVKLRLENIGEGLVSTALTKSNYQETLIAIIEEKESNLGRMRGVMQLGFSMFMISGVLGILLPTLVIQTQPSMSNPFIQGILSLLGFSSAMVLILGIFSAIIIMFGRTVFALAD